MPTLSKKKPASRKKVARTPAQAPGDASAANLSSLLAPKNELMTAVERALLRSESAHASPPIAEQIAARLAGLIALDLLRPGQRLFEVEISQLLHVSRSPVREAIRILERDRLVELLARRGATVTAPDVRDLQDIFEVRAALFSILLDQVMKDRPEALEAVFEDFIPRLARAGEQSPQAYALQSFLFNLAIADLCSNRLVVDQLKALSLRTLRYTRLAYASTAESVPRSLKGWRAFQNAVVKRDIPEILGMAAKRIASIRDLSVTALRKSGNARTIPPL